MAKAEYKMPIYLQLRELIRNKIEEGEYMPGTAIPSENKLAETFGLNRLTIRNAVDALVNEGLLRRVQGKGVFVVGKKNEISIEEHAGFVSAPSRTIPDYRSKNCRRRKEKPATNTPICSVWNWRTGSTISGSCIRSTALRLRSRSSSFPRKCCLLWIRSIPQSSRSVTSCPSTGSISRR